MLTVRRSLENIVLFVLLLLLVDLWISLVSTCPGIDHQSENYQFTPEQCRIFSGPLFPALVWVLRFIEEHHNGVIALFTIILTLSTIGLWLSTRALWRVTRIAAEHIPIVERAFIHGGVHPDGRSLVCDEQKIRVRFSVANYGKTPGFIKSIKVGSGQLDGLSDDPIYSKDVPVSDLYFPMMTMSELRYPDDVEVTVPADGKRVVFQRIFYDDIFEHSHSSGSLHLMYVEDGKIKDKIVTGKPNYWKWD